MKIKDSWILLPVIPLFIQQVGHSENLPAWDDYSMPLGWVVDFSKSNFATKISLLVGQYGEHRLVPSKLIYLLYYYITGSVNFQVLATIGSLQLIPVALIGIYFIRKYIAAHWKVVSFFWVMVVFDFNTYENASMCMCAVGNYGQVFLFFLALYLYDSRRKWLVWCVVVQILCAFSNGNGMLAMLIIPFFNWLKGGRKKAITSGIVAMVCIFLNFYSYHTEPIPTNLPFDLNRSITYFIRMSGAHFSFDNSFWIGIIVLSLLAYLIPKKAKDFRCAGLICILLFSVGTMLLAAYFRGNTSDAQFQTSRYLIYPQMMIGMLIAFLFIMAKEKHILPLGVTLVVLMTVTYYSNYAFGKLGFERTQSRVLTNQFWYPLPGTAEKTSKEACERNIYCIDDHR